MASKSFDHGGITRTLQAPCGWTSKGAVREANGKLRIHMKVCKTCKDVSLSIPECNTSIASINGLNRFNRKGNPAESTVTIVDKEGSSQLKLDCTVQQVFDTSIGLFN